MKTFECFVLDNSGRKLTLMRTASDKNVLLADLAREGLAPVRICESRRDSVSRKRITNRYSSKSLMEWTQVLAVMLESGVHLKEALELIQKIHSRGPLHKLTCSLSEGIAKGESFTDVLSHSVKGLPALYLGFVRIGEKTGSMASSFQALLQFMKRSKKIKDNLVGAVTYPLIVLLTALIGGFVIARFGIPMIMEQLLSAGIDLGDDLTRRSELFYTGGLALGALLLLFVCMAVSISAARKFYPPLAGKLDLLLLTLPFVGRFFLLKEMLVFSFVLETLSLAGFRLEDALGEYVHVTANSHLQSSLKKVHLSVIKGELLSAALSKVPGFPDYAARWIAVGESGGHIGRIFSQIRSYYEDETENLTQKFVTMIGPLLILGVGLFLIAFVILFILPVMKTYGNIL